MVEKAVGMGSDWREARLSCCADPVRTSLTGSLRYHDGDNYERRLKSEFASFQPLSQLLKLVYFVKCKRTLFEPNS